MPVLFYILWFPIRLLTKLTDTAVRYRHSKKVASPSKSFYERAEQAGEPPLGPMVGKPLPEGVRIYRSKWDHKDFGFFTGSSVAEPQPGREGKAP